MQRQEKIVILDLMSALSKVAAVTNCGLLLVVSRVANPSSPKKLDLVPKKPEKARQQF